MSGPSRRSVLVSGLAAATLPLVPNIARAQTLTPLHIACSSVEAQAQGYYASEAGFFKKAGLDVDFLATAGGSATVTAVVGNAVQIGCTNPVSLGQALQRKIPLVILVTSAIWDTKSPSGYAVVAPDSTIKTAKDLNGTTIGVPSLGGLNQLVMTAFIGAGGGDVSSVKFVEIPESLTADALAAHRIAAAFLDEPDYSGAGTRVRSIGAASDAIAPMFAETVWFASQVWASANKDIVKRAVAALIAGGKWAMSNPDLAAGVLAKRLKFVEPKARMRFATTTDPALVQVLLDAAAKYKMLPPIHIADNYFTG